MMTALESTEIPPTIEMDVQTQMGMAGQTLMKIGVLLTGPTLFQMSKLSGPTVTVMVLVTLVHLMQF